MSDETLTRRECNRGNILSLEIDAGEHVRLMTQKVKPSYFSGSVKVMRASNGPAFVSDPFSWRSKPSLDIFLPKS